MRPDPPPTEDRRHPMGASIVLAVVVLALIVLLALVGGLQ